MVRSVMVRALHPLTFRCLRGAAMSAMHEDVHQRTQEEDQEGQPAEQMRSVFEDEKEAGDHEETRQDDIHDRQSTAVWVAFGVLVFHHLPPFRPVGAQADPFFVANNRGQRNRRSEEHTSELKSLMRTSYAVFC